MTDFRKECCCNTGFNPLKFKVAAPTLKSDVPISSLRERSVKIKVQTFLTLVRLCNGNPTDSEDANDE